MTLQWGRKGSSALIFRSGICPSKAILGFSCNFPYLKFHIPTVRARGGGGGYKQLKNYNNNYLIYIYKYITNGHANKNKGIGL